MNPTQRTLLIRLIPPAALMALALLFYHRLVWDGMILARGDVYTYFMPYWSARSAAFLSGQLPLWTPNLFMGIPLLANSQMGTFYPPNWLLTGLSAPAAIVASIALHTGWALMGAYALARRVAGLDRLVALVAALLYGLGGYLGGQSEHINQLQALSWMPWLFLLASSPALHRLDQRGIALFWRRLALLGGGLALQMLAGHPQTVFITLVGLGVYVLAGAVGSPRGQRILLPVRGLALLAGGTVIMLWLASPQLIPTLELSRLSNRSGGLNLQEAMAFSLNPLLIGRGLLPSYDGLLFGEYIAYSGVIGLGLALIGLVRSGDRARWRWAALAVVGLALALGAFNPLYWLLARLPGFSLFRVPARWLALESLGVALLAGYGLQALLTSRIRWRMMSAIIAVTAGLAAASFLAGRAAEEVIGPAEPTAQSLIGWGAALAFLLRVAGSRWLNGYTRVTLLAVGAAVELFLASQIMAYNAGVPPDTYTAMRFTISQLQVYQRAETPPGRMLSITPLEFDPGDVEALQARYDGLGMDELAVRVALVATKLREVIAPNLPLEWNIASLDGFDGGLLPTGAYSAFTSLLLPDGMAPTVDGRLWEMLARPECRGACLPEQRWLNLTNTRYLIVDKVADIWHQDLAYDTALSVTLGPDQPGPIRSVPDFEATALDVLIAGACAQPADCAPVVRLEYADGTSERLTPPGDLTRLDPFWLARFPMAAPRTPVSITLVGGPAGTTVTALTLVDTRTGAFQQLTPGPWRKLLSSDIKLYENLDVLPRAFVVHQALPAADDEAALALMRQPRFDPARMVVLSSPSAPSTGAERPPAGSASSQARITAYEPTRVTVEVAAASPGYLVLTDADYPGWTAAVNGTAVPVERVDVMFRAVPVPAGDSVVEFRYQPVWWPGALIAGAAGWLLLGVALVILWARARGTSTDTLRGNPAGHTA